MYDFSAANEHNCIDSTNKYIKLKKNAWKVMLQIGKKILNFALESIFNLYSLLKRHAFVLFIVSKFSI